VLRNGLLTADATSQTSGGALHQKERRFGDLGTERVRLTDASGQEARVQLALPFRKAVARACALDGVASGSTMGLSSAP
jgi:hypothetical protein